MQTPGKVVEPQTPMIAINRGSDSTFLRLQKVEEDVAKIEKPQIRVFGRVISQLSTINNSMQDMQDLIRQDVDAKRKYFAEETKILDKDSRNLNKIRIGIGRQAIAGAIGIAGLSALSQGKVGEGLTGIGGSAALLSPEILGVVSSVVIGRLAKSGILGGGQNIGSRVSGASKLKNPLLITAALAASLILPGLINSNQSADRRRQLTAGRTISGKDTINRPDVSRFRGILGRFGGILDSIVLDKRKKEGGDVDLEALMEEDKKDNENDDDNLGSIINEAAFPITGDGIPDDEQFNSFFGLKFPKSLNLDGIFKFQGFPENKNDKDVSSSTTFLGDNVNLTAKLEDGNNTKDVSNTSGDSTIGENLASNDILVEGEKDTNISLLNELTLDMIGGNFDQNVASEQGGGNVIDLSQNNDSQDNSSGFSGLAAKTVFVSVGTKYTGSAGVMDKFVASAALGGNGIV